MASRGTDKEVAAVTYNLKQQRILEKTMHTLSLEASYSMKLLDLDHRVIKVNYRRMKDKVSRINSFLPMNEIRELAQLEASGKLRSVYVPPNLSSSLTLASAEKRLKLQSPRRPKTACTLRRDRDISELLELTPRTARTPKDDSEHVTMPVIRPMTAICETTNDSDDLAPQSRPRANTAPLLKSRKPFDSHETTGKETVRTLNSAISATPRPRSTSMLSRPSLDSSVWGSAFEERKSEMLKIEAKKGEELDDKKRCFLKKVGNYVDLNPPKFLNGLPSSKASPQSLGGDATLPPENAEQPRTKRSRRFRKDKFVGLTEAEYNLKVSNSWANISKCRYLRVPSNKQDHSGYNTLVTDQFKLLANLKKSKGSYFKSVQLPSK